jgi:hypothetical protein
MSPKYAAVVILATLALAGCERSPMVTGVSRNFSRSGGPTFDVDAEDADDMQAATGHYEFVGVNTLNDFKYSVSAHRHMDGSVSGEVEERTTFSLTGDLVRDMHGTVTCFTIVGNTAFIAGIVDRVVSYAPGQENLVPGAGFRLVVVDNGNGANDPPDQGSNARFGLPATSQAFCDHPSAFNLEDIQHGNVVVRQ